jgi:hypothetical protein
MAKKTPISTIVGTRLQNRTIYLPTQDERRPHHPRILSALHRPSPLHAQDGQPSNTAH